MFQRTKNILLQVLPVTVIATFLVVAVIYGWTEPSSAPPTGNVSAPINVGNASQIKTGPLQVNGFRNIGNTVFDGNVGIGTAGPAIKLAIGDTDTGLDWVSDGILTVKTNTTERMRIDASGNIGIGTTNPAAKLEVYTTWSEANSPSLKFNTIRYGGADTFFIKAASNFQHGGSIYNQDVFGLNTMGGAFFKGNIGIDTLNPTERLTVKDTFAVRKATGKAVYTYISETTSKDGSDCVCDTSPYPDCATPSFTNNDVGPVCFDRKASSPAKYNVFLRTDYILNTIPTLITTNTGNVGIGTTGPEAKLEVASASQNAFRLKKTAGSAGSVDLFPAVGDSTGRTGTALCQTVVSSAVCLGYWTSAGAASTCATSIANGRALCSDFGD